jgi:hypothetical protein
MQAEKRTVPRTEQEATALSNDDLAALLGLAMSYNLDLANLCEDPSPEERGEAGTRFLQSVFRSKLSASSLVYIAGEARDMWKQGVHELLVLEFVKRLGCRIEQRPTFISTWKADTDKWVDVEHSCWWAIRLDSVLAEKGLAHVDKNNTREREQCCVPWCRPDGFTNNRISRSARVY